MTFGSNRVIKDSKVNNDDVGKEKVANYQLYQKGKIIIFSLFILAKSMLINEPCFSIIFIYSIFVVVVGLILRKKMINLKCKYCQLCWLVYQLQRFSDFGNGFFCRQFDHLFHFFIQYVLIILLYSVRFLFFNFSPSCHSLFTRAFEKSYSWFSHRLVDQRLLKNAPQCIKRMH